MANKRLVDIETPLGSAVWFRQMTGTEALSVPFEFDVVLHSESKTLSLSANAILGKGVTMKVETETGGVRPIHGICTRFASAGREGDHHVYTAKLRPWLWIASRRTNCKIFQFKTVPDIVKEVLGEYPYVLTPKLTKTYRPWDYCVQYQESDMNFVMRLMEHEGIYFYFEHAVGSHTMVIADDMSCHASLPGKSSIQYVGADAATTNMEEHIDSWLVRGEVDSGTFFTDDYDFEHPKADLKAKSNNPMPHTHSEHEHYEWPGGYVKHADGENYAKTGLEMLEAEHERCQANTNVRTMAPGYRFSMTRCPRSDQNREYLAVAATYFFRDNAQLSTGSGEGDADWGIMVTSQPTTLPYRPQLLTPKPRTHGPQTALVVGPAGEEIYTDKYSRVKVQFYWDRVGKKNENSSCWIRVATPWAGEKWGMIHIPRIGHEVVVDFLGGDPDYPLITGSVYNANLMPPYGLPANMTASGIKSRSTKGGSATDFNEIRMEDKKGQEQLYVHAQRNLDTVVEADESRMVGNDRATRINHDDDRFVGNDDRHVIKGNQTVQIDKDHNTKVKGKQNNTVDKDQSNVVHGARTQQVDGEHREETGGSHLETVKKDHNFTVNGKENNMILGGQNNLAKGRTSIILGDDSFAVSGKTSIMSASGYSVTTGMKYAESCTTRSAMVMATDETTVLGKQTETIGGMRDTTIGGIDKTTVAGAQTSTIGAAHSMTVGAASSVTVGGAITRTAGAAISMTAGAAMSFTAGGVVSVTAGGAVTITAGGAVTITAPVIMLVSATVISAGPVITTSVVSPLYTPGIGNIL